MARTEAPFSGEAFALSWPEWAVNSRVLGNRAVSSPDLGRGESAGPWPGPANGRPCLTKGPPCGPLHPSMPLTLKSSPAPHFNLKASWQTMASFPPASSKVATVGCAHTASIESWGWADFIGVFFLLDPHLSPLETLLLIPSPWCLSDPEAEGRTWAYGHVSSQGGLPWAP